MKNNRVERLDSEFRKVIYEILTEDLFIPDITEMFSITEVVTDPDLKHAKVYLSVYSKDEEKKKKTYDAIVKSSPLIRKEIGRKMHIRIVPEFSFVFDTTYEYGNKIDMLLNSINKEESNDKS